MILQQPLERGPQGRAQRDPRAVSGASRGLDARCVGGGPRGDLAQGPRSFGWALRAGLQDDTRWGLSAGLGHELRQGCRLGTDSEAGFWMVWERG